MDNYHNQVLDEEEYEDFQVLLHHIQMGNHATILDILEALDRVDVRENKIRILSLPNDDGLLLLHQAIMQGDLRICQILCDHGASLEVRDRNNLRAIDLAAHPAFNIPNAQELLDFFEPRYQALGLPIPQRPLIQHEQEIFERIIGFIVHDNIENISAELRNMDAGLRNRIITGISRAQGATLLHYAVAERNLAASILLLENGASINIPDYQNITPLELARNQAGCELIYQAFQDFAARGGNIMQDPPQVLRFAAEAAPQPMPNLPAKRKNASPHDQQPLKKPRQDNEPHH